jgi:hypothetical protein
MDAIRNEIEGIKDAGKSVVAVVLVVSPFAMAIAAILSIFT